MEHFKVIKPSPALAPYVQRYWILKMDTIFGMEQRIIPNGCMELMFCRGDRMMFSSGNVLHPVSYIKGQNTKFYDLLLTGKVNLISVSFTPLGMSAFSSVPISEFSYGCVDILDVNDGLLNNLSNRISETVDDETCIRLIEEFLIRRFNPIRDYNCKRLSAVIHAINNEKQIDVTTLSEVSCVSYRQFIRVFTEHVGLNPKEYLRIVRFQRALSIMNKKPLISSIDLAFEAGYYDQSHLINDFKGFTGNTPLEYLAICQPRSDYFS